MLSLIAGQTCWSNTPVKRVSQTSGQPQVVLDTNSNYLFHVGPATEVYLPALLSRGLNVPLGNAMVIGTTGGLSNATTGGISAAQAAAIDWSTFLLPSTGKPVDLSGESLSFGNAADFEDDCA